MNFRSMWSPLLAAPAFLLTVWAMSAAAIAADGPRDAGSASTDASQTSAAHQTNPSSEQLPPASPPAAAKPAIDLAAPATAPATTIGATDNFQPATEPPAEAAETTAAPLLEAPTASIAAPTAPAVSAPIVGTAEPDVLEQVVQYSNDRQRQATAGQSLAQITSVTQLSDVQPTDWAYQALQSLVERYGCIVGYPDGTYKGSRALTRYEFAAGVNACLDRIAQLIDSSVADLATKEDLATLQRLQEEFAAELATLRGRVDALEARTTELEANQFSTTTKLAGETIFSIADIYGDGVSDANETVFQYRVRMNLNTSFTGEDLLNARLQYSTLNFFNPGENRRPASLTDGDVTAMVGFPDQYLRQTSLYYQFGSNDTLVLQRLYYSFPVGDKTLITLGAIGTGISDIVTTVSPIDAGGYGAVGLLAYNPIYDAGSQGTGLGITYEFTDELQLGVGYLSGTAQNSTPGFGLFNGGYSAFGQLTLLTDFISVGLIYLNAYNNQESSGLPAAVTNQYGATVNFAITDSINIGGWVNFENAVLIERADYESWTYAGYFAWNDLGAENNQLTIVVGVPPRISDYKIGDTRIGEFINDAALNVEASYRISVTDNISITPGLIYVADPGSDNDNSDVFLGVVRTTFYF